MRIIKAKIKGKKPELESLGAPPPDAEVIDLMSRLRESLEQGKKKRPAAKRGRSRARASRKTAASEDAPDSRRSA